MTEHLFFSFSSRFRTCITSQQYILTMWATGFYIMENYHVDLKDLEFPSKILQVRPLSVLPCSAQNTCSSFN